MNFKYFTIVLITFSSLNQILSRSKPASEVRYGGGSTKKVAFPELEDFLLKRDYIGAITMLEVIS